MINNFYSNSPKIATNSRLNNKDIKKVENLDNSNQSSKVLNKLKSKNNNSQIFENSKKDEYFIFYLWNTLICQKTAFINKLGLIMKTLSFDNYINISLDHLLNYKRKNDINYKL